MWEGTWPLCMQGIKQRNRQEGVQKIKQAITEI